MADRDLERLLARAALLRVVSFSTKQVQWHVYDAVGTPDWLDIAREFTTWTRGVYARKLDCAVAIAADPALWREALDTIEPGEHLVIRAPIEALTDPGAWSQRMTPHMLLLRSGHGVAIVTRGRWPKHGNPVTVFV